MELSVRLIFKWPYSEYVSFAVIGRQIEMFRLWRRPVISRRAEQAVDKFMTLLWSFSATSLEHLPPTRCY